MRVTSYINLLHNQIGVDKKSLLGLKLGELLTAKILKVGPEIALLELKGQKVLAETKTNLLPGDEVQVRVTGEQQNRIILKILDESSPISNSLDQLLTKFGVQPDKDSRVALDFLLKNNLPVNQNTLKALITDQKIPLINILTKIFNQSTDTLIQSPLLQHSNLGQSNDLSNSLRQSVPQGSESITDNNSTAHTSDFTLRQTQSILNNDSTNQESIQKPGITTGQYQTLSTPYNGDSFQKLQSTSISGTGQSQQTIGSDNSLQKSINLTNTGSAKGGTWQTGENSSLQSTNTNNFSNTPKNLSLIRGEGQERQLTVGQHVTRPTTNPGEKIAPQFSIQGETQPTTETQHQGGKINDTIAKLVQLQQTDTQRHSLEELANLKSNSLNSAPLFRNNTAQNIQTQRNPYLAILLEQLGLGINPERNIPEISRSLKNFIQNLGLFHSKSEELTETKEKTSPSLLTNNNTPLSEEQKDGVREFLDKIIGIRLRQKPDDLLLHLEIPLLFNQHGTALVQVREDRTKPQKEHSQKPLHILFHLDIETLGQMKILIILYEKEMNCQFSAQREKTRTLFRKFIPDLKERLEKLSFKVNGMGVSALLENEEIAETTFPGQIDFRV